MPHFEVGFKFQHDCPLTRITQKYPTSVISWWCNFDTDIVEASYDGTGRSREFDRDFRRMIRELGGTNVRSTSTASGLQAVVRCTCLASKRSIASFFEKHGCLEIYPAVYTRGWEWYRMIALTGTHLKGFFDDLDKTGKVEITSKREVRTGSIRDTFAISTASLFGNLTEKQAMALQWALGSGYYALPKRTSTRALAKYSGVTRTTFEEHLRIAESKLMGSLAPYARFSVGDGNVRRSRDNRTSSVGQHQRRMLSE